MKTVAEGVVALATVGAGVVDHEDDAEQIRVMDTQTGSTCFNLESEGRLGKAGELHADMSPSGRYIVVTRKSGVWVYELPPNCRVSRAVANVDGCPP